MISGDVARGRCFERRLGEASDRLREARIGMGRIRGTFEPMIDALPNLGIIVLLVIGSWQVSIGRLNTGQVVQADCLCDGRLLLGVGRGAFAYELARLGRPIEESRARFDESFERGETRETLLWREAPTALATLPLVAGSTAYGFLLVGFTRRFFAFEPFFLLTSGSKLCLVNVTIDLILEVHLVIATRRLRPKVFHEAFKA